MPAPSELAPYLRIGTPEGTRDAVTRSHLADGRVVGWYGAPGVVIDAELTDQPVPSAMAARFGADDFWGRWTRAECVAKAADTPIVMLLAADGLDGGSRARTIELPGVTVSVL